jgi:hypothetical protein
MSAHVSDDDGIARSAAGTPGDDGRRSHGEVATHHSCSQNPCAEKLALHVRVMLAKQRGFNSLSESTGGDRPATSVQRQLESLVAAEFRFHQVERSSIAPVKTSGLRKRSRQHIGNPKKFAHNSFLLPNQGSQHEFAPWQDPAEHSGRDPRAPSKLESDQAATLAGTQYG